MCICMYVPVSKYKQCFALIVHYSKFLHVCMYVYIYVGVYVCMYVCTCK
jgi:hypothetical protein